MREIRNYEKFVSLLWAKIGLKQPNFCDLEKMERSVLAGLAETEELQLVLNLSESTGVSDFVFEMLYGTGEIQNCDRAAVSANQVILVVPLAKAIVCRTAVEADSSNNPMFLQACDQAIHSGRIAIDIKVRVPSDLLKCQRPIGRRENVKTSTKCGCFPQTGFGTFLKKVGDYWKGG